LIEPVYYAAPLKIEIPIELAAKYVYAVDAASNSTVPVPSIVASPPATAAAAARAPSFAIRFP